MSIFTNYGIKFQKSGEKIQNYVKFISEETRTITPKYANSGITLQYSVDKGENWTTISSGSTTDSAKEIWFRGKATGTKSLFINSSTSNKWTFSGDSTNEIKIVGNLMFLLCDELGSVVAPTTVASYCFAYMFSNAPIINAFELKLPATTLADYCYYQMFYGCSLLETAPELPATTLANYCYGGMFRNCSSLEEASELPATTLADYCYYQMFYGCSSLKTAPELPATTLAERCYLVMFSGCSSLLQAPELPATTLTSSCYQDMFNGCSLLENIHLAYENNDNPNNAFTNWVSGISSTGTLYKKGTLFASSGNNTYPSTWTQVAWL